MGNSLNRKKMSSEEDRTHDAVSSGTTSPRHYQRAIPAPTHDAVSSRTASPTHYQRATPAPKKHLTTRPGDRSREDRSRQGTTGEAIPRQGVWRQRGQVTPRDSWRGHPKTGCLETERTGHAKGQLERPSLDRGVWRQRGQVTPGDSWRGHP